MKLNAYSTSGSSPTQEQPVRFPARSSFWISPVSESRRVPLLPVDAEDLRDRLHVLSQVASHLRSQQPRNQRQVATIESEIDAILQKLGRL